MYSRTSPDFFPWQRQQYENRYHCRHWLVSQHLSQGFWSSGPCDFRTFDSRISMTYWIGSRPDQDVPHPYPKCCPILIFLANELLTQGSRQYGYGKRDKQSGQVYRGFCMGLGLKCHEVALRNYHQWWFIQCSLIASSPFFLTRYYD